MAERPFTFSALPGRNGAQIIGGVGMLGLILAAVTGLLAGDDAAARSVVACTFLVAGVTGSWLGGRRGTRSSLRREHGVNLEAIRGTEPRVWLVAHIDSKSQPISTAVRTAGVVLLTAAGLVGLAGAVASFFGDIPGAVWELVGALAAFGGIPLLASTVGTSSHGAADNASGVAAVLGAAALVKPGRSFGVLITDAEEIALAGARAWVEGRGAGIAINCDTIDDGGRFVIMRYREGPAALAKQAGALATAIDRKTQVIRPVPGVLTDSVAFQDAGWETVTLSRGTIRTLNRIHTQGDNLGALRGTAIPDASRILARLVEELA